MDNLARVKARVAEREARLNPKPKKKAIPKKKAAAKKNTKKKVSK